MIIPNGSGVKGFKICVPVVKFQVIKTELQLSLLYVKIILHTY